MKLSNQNQLTLMGIVLLCLLSVCAWNVGRPLTWDRAPILALLGYAAWRIVYELSWNRHNVPTLATSWVGRRRMASVIRSHMDADRPYKIVDLGSGRGELSRSLAKSLPETHITGIELAVWPYRQSRILQRLLGPQNITYQQLDFDQYHCGNENAVVMFLSGNLTAAVGDKLKQELKTGALVISHTFPLKGDWTPSEVISFRTPFFKDKIYVYHKN